MQRRPAGSRRRQRSKRSSCKCAAWPGEEDEYSIDEEDEGGGGGEGNRDVRPTSMTLPKVLDVLDNRRRSPKHLIDHPKRKSDHFMMGTVISSHHHHHNHCRTASGDWKKKATTPAAPCTWRPPFFRMLTIHRDTTIFPIHASAGNHRNYNADRMPAEPASVAANVDDGASYIKLIKNWPPLQSAAGHVRAGTHENKKTRSKPTAAALDDSHGCCNYSMLQQHVDGIDEDVEAVDRCPTFSAGWPLLQRTSNYSAASAVSHGSRNSDEAAARDELSVVEWALRLPARAATIIEGVPDHQQLLQEQQLLLADDAEIVRGRMCKRLRAKIWRQRRRRNGVAAAAGVVGLDGEARHRSHNDGGDSMVAAVKQRVEQLCRGTVCKEFDLLEIEVATGSFAQGNVIGEGGCSRVYRGMLGDGKLIAVKRLLVERQGMDMPENVLAARESGGGDGEAGDVSSILLMEAFVREVEMGSRMQHRHISKLLGYCIHYYASSSSENHPRSPYYLLLVYNLASGGSLEKMLHPPPHHAYAHGARSGGGGRKMMRRGGGVMPWSARFRVAVGVAEALQYLHHVSAPAIIHRDIKSANILLSSNLEPQLADFGLALWVALSTSSNASQIPCSDVVGTFGYLAPEYVMCKTVSKKTDVYSFGVVLLELITGRKPIEYSDHEEELSTVPRMSSRQMQLVSWATRLLVEPFDESNIAQLVDPKLAGAYDANQLKQLAIVAAHCLRHSPRSRPPISWVLRFLMGEVQLETDSCSWAPEETCSLSDDGSYDDGIQRWSGGSRHTDSTVNIIDHETVSYASQLGTSNVRVMATTSTVPTGHDHSSSPNLSDKSMIRGHEEEEEYYYLAESFSQSCTCFE